MTKTKRFSRIITFALVMLMVVAMAVPSFAASGPFSYGYTVTEANTNTVKRDKTTNSSVKHHYISGLPNMRTAVYAVTPSGASYNATQTAAKYYNFVPGQTTPMYNTVREDGNNECYLSFSAYPGWSAYCNGRWWPDI